MPRYSLDYIKNLDYDQLKDMPEDKLRAISKQATAFSKTRARRLEDSYRKKVEESIEGGYRAFPIPHALSEESVIKYEAIVVDQSKLKERGQIIHNILLNKQWLNLKSSTMKGWEKIVRGGIKIIEEISGVTIRKKDYRLFYDVINTIENVIPDQVFGKKYGAYKYVAEAINSSEFKSMNPEEIATTLINRIMEDIVSNDDGDDDDDLDDKYRLGSK